MLSTVTAASTRFARPIVSRLATATQQSTKTKFHCHFSSVSNTSSKMTLTTLPSVSVLQGFPDPQSINLSDYCAGKNILLIGLPGAFTPTWSATQVPGYLEKQEELKAAGIEEVIVYCVNDPAVSKFSACCVEWMNRIESYHWRFFYWIVHGFPKVVVSIVVKYCIFHCFALTKK